MLPQGLFKLAAPTGGGKTLSLMGFALHHAIANKQNRIIYAAPFTSILDQTANIYRQLFGDEAVLEYHSAVREENVHNDHMGMRRLAAQNWDFPIIVTTTVQLLESLFSHQPSRCRKLHNIANSTIVLDEVQALPIKYLHPILSMLKALTDEYGCSVVFCTATQPAYKYIKGVNNWQPTEIIPEEAIARHFLQLKRVEYRNQTVEEWTWKQVVADIQARGCDRVLIVCNSTTDAQTGFTAIRQLFAESECFHLSTRMYGAHRHRVVNQLKELLLKQRVCLISTQVIEAGVDLDFADGYRVIAPLDSIVQTAGRINRNASLGRFGTLTVFRLQGGKFPNSTDYKLAARTSQEMLDRGLDLNEPKIFEEYFKKRFRSQNFDQEKIQEARKERKFESVSQKFKLIDEDTISVLVPHAPEAKTILAALQNKTNLDMRDYQIIQPYLVSLRSSFLKQRSKDYEELKNGLLVWRGQYDSKCGIV